ncbi:MAG: YraN family protein [Patescibacteria group bacterium]
MNQKSQLGREGEDFACEYLVDKGFKIIDRNCRKPWGELDIVAISPDKTLVFAEVKTMSGFNDGGLKPEDQMSRSKIERFRRVAQLYAGSNEKLIDENKGWRLDLISLTKIGKDFILKHYEQIV